MHSRALSPLIAVLGLLLPAALPAQLIYSTGFEASEGFSANATINGVGGFTGVANATTTTAAALGYSSGNISLASGNFGLQLSNTVNTTAFSHTFASQTGTLFFSFLVQHPVGKDDNDFLMFGFGNSTTSVLNQTLGSVLNGAGSSYFKGRVRASSAGGGTATNAGVLAAPIGSPALVVGKLSFNGTSYDRIDYWLNPSSSTEPSVDPAQTTTYNGSVALNIPNIDRFFAFAGASNESDDTYYLDNLAIGTTYGSVVGIPEPSAIGLGALGMFALSAVRRRRR
jgi:hypothetical protein